MKEGWVRNRLGAITTKIGSGATPRGGEESYKETGTPLIRSMNVHDWGFKEAKLARIDNIQAAQLSNVVVERDDVLLNITGASVARCCVAPEELLPARVNQHVSIIRPRKDEISSAFLQYLLISQTYKNRLLHTGEAGSTRQAITKAQIEDFVVEYPKSLPEQQRIVGILDEAFAGLATAKANAETNLQNARALFESHLQSVFAQDWQTRELVTLADLATDITDGDHQPPPKSTNGVPFITIGNIDKETREISFRDTFMVPLEYFKALKPYKKPRRGDVLYTVTGSFGIPVIVPDDTEFCFQRHIGLIRPRPETNSDWLYYLLLSPQLIRQANEGATGTAQKTVSLKLLRSFVVPKVPLSQQKHAVEKLGALSKETQRLTAIYTRKLAALEELKKALLHQAFSGEL
jgi:type I restriction enzyme S subunit